MATVSQRERPDGGGAGRAGRAGRGGRGGTNRGGTNTEAENRTLGLSTGWNVFSYLIAGMAAYGGIGWLVGRAVHVALLFPLGMIVGLGISAGWIIYRYGRAGDGVPGTGGGVPGAGDGVPGAGDGGPDEGYGHGKKRGDDR